MWFVRHFCLFEIFKKKRKLVSTRNIKSVVIMRQRSSKLRTLGLHTCLPHVRGEIGDVLRLREEEGECVNSVQRERRPCDKLEHESDGCGHERRPNDVCKRAKPRRRMLRAFARSAAGRHLQKRSRRVIRGRISVVPMRARHSLHAWPTKTRPAACNPWLGVITTQRVVLKTAHAKNRRALAMQPPPLSPPLPVAYSVPS